MTAPSAADLHATVRGALDMLEDAGEPHAALDALLARCEEAEEDYRIVKALRSGCACGDDEACAFVRRAEAAERERDEVVDAYHARLRKKTAALARVAELEAALRACRELFVELRGDWSDNRGPCREGLAIIDAVLQSDR